MKKVFFIFIICSVLFLPVVGASYADNPYQQLAKEYHQKAQVAFDEGDYDTAVELSKLAAENTELSEAYINSMIARSDANKQIQYAKNQLAWAEKIHGDIYFPMTFTSGKQSLDNAEAAFAAENYETASVFAKEALSILSEIKEVTPLPQYYVVRPWAETKDCYWNISGRSYVYNNPTLWENLYQANKSNMKDPANPDLIYPGMQMEIPSITGEFREGTYDTSKKYDPYTANR